MLRLKEPVELVTLLQTLDLPIENTVCQILDSRFAYGIIGYGNFYLLTPFFAHPDLSQTSEHQMVGIVDHPKHGLLLTSHAVSDMKKR
jgi:hypothetical protein